MQNFEVHTPIYSEETKTIDQSWKKIEDDNDINKG
jgi:hypothetical protein